MNNFRVDFDPAKFKKPEPFYGFIHDQYVVPSENRGANVNEAKSKFDKKTFLNSNLNAGNSTQGAVSINTNFNNAKSMKDSVGGPKR